MTTSWTTTQDHAFTAADNSPAGPAGSTTGSGPLGWTDVHGGVASVAGGQLQVAADGTDGNSFARDLVIDPNHSGVGYRVDVLIPPGGTGRGVANPSSAADAGTAVDIVLRRQSSGDYYLALWQTSPFANSSGIMLYAIAPNGSPTGIGSLGATPAYDPTHYYLLTAYDAATAAASLSLRLVDLGAAAPPAGPLYNLDGTGTVLARIDNQADSTAALQQGGSFGLCVHPTDAYNAVSWRAAQVTTSAPATTPTPTPTSTTLSPGTLAVAPGNPSSSCLTIAQGTAPSGGTGPYTVAAISRTFDGGTTFAPVPVAAYPVYDSEVAPRTTVGYRALILDSAGSAAWTPTATATTTAPTGTQTKLLVCGIDSKTNGYLSSPQMGQVSNPVNSGTSTPAWLGMLLGDSWDVQNVGYDGQTIPQAQAANREAQYFNASKYTGGQYFLLFGGCNDLRGGATAAQAYANLEAYAAQLVGAGWKLIVCTNPDNVDPQSSYTTSGQDQFNALIRAGWQGDLGAVALCDYAASNLFGLDGTTGRADRANYWATADAPKVEHYNDRGYRELAKFAAGAIGQACSPAASPSSAPPAAIPPQFSLSLQSKLAIGQTGNGIISPVAPLPNGQSVAQLQGFGVTVPASVTIPPGVGSVNFPITPTAGGYVVVATIRATRTTTASQFGLAAS